MAKLWDATVTVECDQCGEQVEVDTVELAADGIMADDDTLLSLGWSVDDDDLCPNCQEDTDAQLD